ncbi:MAG: helicase-related protein, partial [Jatrophihabitans sp.]
KIRYVHEARNDKEKGEMFAAARNGRISVLLGSTEKMGVGTNVQARAIALHHLDCPWRPADIAQREGRLLRQGNLNPEVEVIRYVSEGSFDAYLWQTVERKARFIGQVMRGRLDVREIEDIGDTALSYLLIWTTYVPPRAESIGGLAPQRAWCLLWQLVAGMTSVPASDRSGGRGEW